jgi:xanthine dehydrogenase accessory factor
VVLALTHDPSLDDMALLDALNSPAFYVGAIGSRVNSDRRRERLRTLGITAQQLARLHAPVGLPIGSRSPPEIAVSILAEITALRHRAKQPSGVAAIRR